jgi:hypothetical protein
MSAGAANGSMFRDVYGARLLTVVFFVLIFSGMAGISGNLFQAIDAAAGEPSLKDKSMTTGWEGNESELAEPFTGIVTSEDDWKKLWKTAFRSEAPAVDFRLNAVACVFLGHYPGWWYHIDLSQPSVSDSTIIVPYQLVDLIVELTRDENGAIVREYGRRGQYKMLVVEKKPGFSIKLEQVGKPQVPLKSSFRKILEKDRTGVLDEK